MADLAIVLYHQGHINAAEMLQLRAFEWSRVLGGDQTSQTAIYKHQLGVIISAKGKNKQAYLLLSEAMITYKQVYGEGCSHIIGCLADILHLPSENWTDQIVQDSLRTISKTAIPAHRKLNMGRLLLGVCGYYNSVGEYNRAMEVGTRGLNLLVETQGSENGYAYTAAGTLVESQLHMGLTDAAYMLSTLALRHVKHCFGIGHLATLVAETTMVECFLHQGLFADAETWARRALKQMIELVGEKNVKSIVLLEFLAVALKNQGYHEEAIATRDKVYRFLAEDTPNSVLTRQCLASLETWRV
ncbi:hypothetical protein GQ53DRAFT_749570 [Thozetella sp. PMI_491]|nr:hypothetical protein GQ53DRAFT_749570 [Thozetella sp. PMI_491]